MEAVKPDWIAENEHRLVDRYAAMSTPDLARRLRSAEDEAHDSRAPWFVTESGWTRVRLIGNELNRRATAARKTA